MRGIFFLGITQARRLLFNIVKYKLEISGSFADHRQNFTRFRGLGGPGTHEALWPLLSHAPATFGELLAQLCIGRACLAGDHPNAEWRGFL